MVKPFCRDQLLSLLFSICLSLFIPFSAHANKNDHADIIAGIVKSIEKHEGYPGVSIAVFYKDELHYVNQVGLADISEEKAPDRNTIFRMYSLTKGITNILAAILVDKGALDLDAPISKYVSKLPEKVKSITARQLLSNQGGIRHYKSNQEWLELSQNHCKSPKDAFDQFLNDPLIAEPGTKISYSSFGYVLLSQVLENAGGMPFKQLMESSVWKQSNVKRIELDNSGKATFKNTSIFYEPLDDRYVEAPFVDNSCKFGAGAINATPIAIAKVFSDFYHAKLTSYKTLKQFVPAISQWRHSISFGGEGLGGRSALVAYPADK